MACMMECKVAFYKGKDSWIDRFIAWYCRGEYSHCELVMTMLDDSKGVCLSSSMQDGGVRIKAINFNPDHWDLVTVSVDLDRLNRWIQENLGMKYDRRGLFGFVLRRIPEKKKRWYCSEAVADIMGLGDPWRFDPCSLAAVCKRI